MVKPKDPFWGHAVNLGHGRFRCNFCGKEFSGGASRIKYHLSRNRGWGIEICEEVPKETQLEAHQVTGNPPKRVKTMATSTSFLEGESIMSSLTLQMSNSKRTNKSEVDMLYAKYTLINKVLSDATRSAIFTDFVNGVAKYGCSYELPSSSVLKLQLVPNIREEVHEYVRNAITFARETGCTLYYSSSLSSVFAYTPNGVVFVDSILLSEATEVDIISSAIERLGATSVVQLIIDNPRTILRNALPLKFRSIPRTPCAMRAINTMFKTICHTSFVGNILSLAIMMDHFICKYKINVQVQYQWGDYWGLHELTSLRPLERRYYWGVHKLTSLLEVESKLRDLKESIVTLSSERWKLIVDGTTYFEDAKYVDFLIHCEEFWHQGKLAASILRPIVEAFYQVVDNGPSFGQLYEAMENVKDAARECSVKNHNFKYIQTVLRGIRGEITQPMHVAAAFLNPTYMCRRESKEDSEMKNAIRYVLDHLVKNEEKEIFMNQVEQYRQMLSKMSTDEITTRQKASQTGIWWNCCGSDLHVLKRYAIRVLNQPCSSSFCPQYQLLGKSHGDQSLAINTILMEKHKSPKTQMLESTVSNEQYEEQYRRVICWLSANFLRITHDPTHLWSENII